MNGRVVVGVAERPRNEFAVDPETDRNFVSVIDHCALLERALARADLSGYEAAAFLRMSPANYTRSLSRHYRDQNVVMKRLSVGLEPMSEREEQALRAVNYAYASLLAEAVGLNVGIQAEEVEQARKFVDAFESMVRSVR